MVHPAEGAGMNVIEAVKADMAAIVAGTAPVPRTAQEHRLRMAANLLLEWEHRKHDAAVRIAEQVAP